MLNIEIKSFNLLSVEELYKILQLRSDVFVVEQNCVYQDMDGKDRYATHVLGYKNGSLVAYTRIFKPKAYFEEASIGRVLVKKEYRAFKYGYDIMNASIAAIAQRYGTTTIKISAQAYLQQFYTNLGFKKMGEPYLEDDIPHIAMIKH